MRLRRAAWPILAVVLVGALLVGVFPSRAWLAQRQAISAEEARVEVLEAENKRLSARVSELHTDAEIERLAREQYNLVKPGEEAYAILPAPGDAEPSFGQPPAPPKRRDEDRNVIRRFWDAITDLL